jgi:hypothetical protein
MTSNYGICAWALCMFAQLEALPTAGWETLTASAVCLGVLVWLIIKRIPQTEQMHADTIKEIVLTHHNAVKDVCETHRVCIAEIKQGLDGIENAVERGNDTQSMMLRETILTKQKIEQNGGAKLA